MIRRPPRSTQGVSWQRQMCIRDSSLFAAKQKPQAFTVKKGLQFRSTRECPQLSRLNSAFGLNRCWADTPTLRAVHPVAHTLVQPSVCDPEGRPLQRLARTVSTYSAWEIWNLTHHQCPTLLIPSVGQSLNLVARCLERNNALPIRHFLVNINSLMAAKW